MSTFFEILILILTLGVIGYPIFRKSKKPLEVLAGEGDTYHELLYKKDAAYTAIKDLEFDYQSGKLSEEDYSQMKEQFDREAISILEKIDQLEKKEKKLAVPVSSKPKTVFCAQCGKRNQVKNNFCFSCGTKLITQ